MSHAILFHFVCAQHVSDINISIIRSLRLCCWITTSVVLFCKDGVFSVSVNLWCSVVCVRCDVFCRFVVVGRRILIDIDRYLLWFVIIVLLCVVCFIGWLVIWCIVNVFCYMVIQQHSRMLLMMDILISETWWVHKKWNKTASDNKLVFYSSGVVLRLWWIYPKVSKQHPLPL